MSGIQFPVDAPAARNNNTAAKGQQKKADAWANVSITDKNGRKYKLGGAPLYKSQAVLSAILDAKKNLLDYEFKARILDMIQVEIVEVEEPSSIEF